MNKLYPRWPEHLREALLWSDGDFDLIAVLRVLQHTAKIDDPRDDLELLTSAKEAGIYVPCPDPPPEYETYQRCPNCSARVKMCGAKFAYCHSCGKVANLEAYWQFLEGYLAELNNETE